MSARLDDWKPITPTAGDGDREAIGLVAPTLRLEPKPCQHCRSFEKQGERLVQHFRAHGCTVSTDGIVTTPIAKDFPGRRSLKLDLRVFGWCRLLTMPVDMQATCDKWVPTAASARFLGLVR